jgi:hypothetical protein
VNDAALQKISPIYLCDDSYRFGEYLRRSGFVVIMRSGRSNPDRRARVPFMVTVVKHRKVNIVVLAPDEPIGAYCAPGDIVIVADADGWWNHFIGSDGAVDSYDRPYHSYNEALWAAKAAAEFGFS